MRRSIRWKWKGLNVQRMKESFSIHHLTFFIFHLFGFGTSSIHETTQNLVLFRGSHLVAVEPCNENK